MIVLNGDVGVTVDVTVLVGVRKIKVEVGNKVRVLVTVGVIGVTVRVRVTVLDGVGVIVGGIGTTDTTLERV